MDIYGELSVEVSGKSDSAMRGTREEAREIGHGARTYAAGTDIGINSHLGFSYSVTTERNPVVSNWKRAPNQGNKGKRKN